MRIGIITTLVTGLVVGACFGKSASVIQKSNKTEGIGPSAPPIVLRDIRGEMTYLSEYCGKTLKYPWKNKVKYAIVISFWARTCPACLAEIPELEKVVAKYPDEVKTFLVNVDQKDPRVIMPFITERKFKSTILLDRYLSTYKRYGEPGLPTTFIVDPEGMIYYTSTGYEGPEDMVTMDQVLSSLVEEVREKRASGK